MASKARAAAETGTELANAFELMMRQLLLLGHTLPQSAASLTPQQLKVLFTLEYVGAPVAMSALAARLGVTPGTLTKVAARLVRASYLDRRRSSQDDRVVNLSLTRQGRRTITTIRQYRRAFFGRLCARLSATQRVNLIDSHRYIYETYRHLLQAGAAEPSGTEPGEAAPSRPRRRPPR